MRNKYINEVTFDSFWFLQKSFFQQMKTLQNLTILRIIAYRSIFEPKKENKNQYKIHFEKYYKDILVFIDLVNLKKIIIEDIDYEHIEIINSFLHKKFYVTKYHRYFESNEGEGEEKYTLIMKNKYYKNFIVYDLEYDLNLIYSS